jgi:hypothetical protein
VSEISNEQIIYRCQEIVDHFVKNESVQREKHIEKIMKSIEPLTKQKNIVDYKILFSHEEQPMEIIKDLEKQIKDHCIKGWRGVGNPSFRYFPIQAMVKYEDDK